MTGRPIKVMVVDDSVVIRRLLTSLIDQDPALEVAGVAQNGRVAVERVDQIQPDVVTLDIEMPEMDGLEALKVIRQKHPTLPVVMFSTLTARGAESTLNALAAGASDYVCKPANVGSVNEGMARVRDELVPKLKALVPPRRLTAPPLTAPASTGAPAPLRRAARRPAPAPKPAASGSRAPISKAIDVLAIGSSTGGPNALTEVLPKFGANFPVPILITQHMPAVFTKSLADRLDSQCQLTVVEAEPGMVLQPGHAYIAPGDYHMVVEKKASTVEIRTNQDDPVNYCRPAVDVMLRSLPAAYKNRILVAILTGMGADGRDACAELYQSGVQVIAQDEATSVVWGMPGAVADANVADEILPLNEIGRVINGLVHQRAPLSAGVPS